MRGAVAGLRLSGLRGGGVGPGLGVVRRLLGQAVGPRLLVGALGHHLDALVTLVVDLLLDPLSVVLPLGGVADERLLGPLVVLIGDPFGALVVVLASKSRHVNLQSALW